MESMVDLDNIDEVGMPELAIVSFTEYRRQHDSRAVLDAPSDMNIKA